MNSIDIELPGSIHRQITSFMFHTSSDVGEVAEGWSTGQLRDLMAEIAVAPGWVEGADTEEDIRRLGVDLTKAGGVAVAQGHCFELDFGSAPLNAFTTLVNDYMRVGACVPYPAATTILFRVLATHNGIQPSSRPMLVVVGGHEATGRLTYAFWGYPVVTSDGRTGGIVPHAVVAFEWHERTREYQHIIDMRGSDRDNEQLNTMASLTIAFLALIADERQPIERARAAPKVNRAREKRGKPPIPDTWKLRYISQLSRPGHVKGQKVDKGGTHSSPRPHDRRGHDRHLASGRTVWVRPSRIGEIERHLTRDRDFYRIALQGAST